MIRDEERGTYYLECIDGVPATAAEDPAALRVGDVVEIGPVRFRVDAVVDVDGVAVINEATMLSVDPLRLAPEALVYTADGGVTGPSFAAAVGMTRDAESRLWVGDATIVARAVEGAVEPSDKDDPLPPLPASTEPTDGDLTRAVRAWDTAMPNEAGMLEAEVEES